MKVNNPYLESKRDLLKHLDQAKDPAEFQDLQAKYNINETKLREYNNKLMSRLADNLDTVKETKTEIKEKRTEISQRKQYSQAIHLYALTRDLLLELRELKKGIRESITLGSEKNKIQERLESFGDKK